MPRTRRQRQSTRRPRVQRTGSEPDEGGQYLRQLVAEQELVDNKDDNRASNAENNFDNNGSAFSLGDLTESSDDSTFDTSWD